MEKVNIIEKQVIKETVFTMEATVLSLDAYPTNEQMDELFAESDSIVLEF